MMDTPTGKESESALYITRDGGLALDVVKFLSDPVVQERIKILGEMDFEETGKSKSRER